MSSFRIKRLLPFFLLIAVGVAFGFLSGVPGRNGVGAQDIDTIMRNMTVAEKVGQLVMIGFPGTTAGTEAKILIRNHHVGGVILFGRNMSTPLQTAFLTNELQKMAVSSGAKVPLFVATDQEGGLVVRLPEATPYPGNMALGAIGDPELVRRIGKAVGEELRAAGINVNFAPVLDVNSNPDNPVIGVRSFGESPQMVANLGIAMIEGLQSSGVIATAKHFPGHGDTSLDSHIALPTVPHDLQRLQKVELFPFQKAVEKGVDAIMTAHITFPAIDDTPGMPATLSEPVLTGLLRNEMGFEGLIFTDAMEMRAIADNFGSVEAAVKAINAGADMVLVAWPREWTEAVDVVKGLVRAAENGQIPMTRVDESLRRVLRTKKERGILEDYQVDMNETESKVGSEADKPLAVEAARRSVTLVRNDEGILPLTAEKAGSVLVIMPRLQALTGVEEGIYRTDSLSKLLEVKLRKAVEAKMDLRPSYSERRALVRRAEDYDTVVVLTYRAWSSRYSGQARLVSDLVKAGKQVIAIALREPYDLVAYPDVETYLATYNATPLTVQVLAEILLGEVSPQGKLPVQIPGYYPVGHGLGY